MAIRIFLSCILAVLCSNIYGSHAQIAPNISLGSSITAGSNISWRSLSGDFAFGFYSLSTGLYLVGIWFDEIPEKTLIWSGNRDTPVEAGSTIRLTYAGQLFLTYFNGSSVQPIYTGAAAALGFMQNDGSFVLKDSNSKVIWMSFNSPTDTILPGQVLVAGRKLYSNAKGTTDYSTGNFMLEMQTDGNLVLSAYHFSDPGYWYTGTIQNNVSLVFNHSAFMYVVNATGDEIYSMTRNISNRVEDYYHRATIDDNGNFQQFVYSKANGSGWTRVWRAINEPCFVNSICGVYGMCSSPDNETLTCNCLPGFIPLDPEHVSRGCRPETVVNYCAYPSMRNFTVEVILDADFPFEGFADLGRVRNVDVEGCKAALMADCYALAASLDDSRCNKKRTPLLNARKSASTKGITALIKVPLKMSNPDASKVTKKNKFHVRDFLKISFITSGALAFLFGALAIYSHLTARRLIRRKRYSNANDIGISFREFTFQELREATDGFSKTLGNGSSGTVYSGVLRLKNMQVDIAVKSLKNDAEKSEKEFMTELRIIGRTHHKSLVRLLGFCIENDQRILVYELMANGALSGALFGKKEKPNWDQRAEMALGVARGLLYLHEECETQIIHCDIKPQNVLLDANYTAKIADFGLSKLLNEYQTKTDTNIRGTMGYMAPEWLRRAPITAKVDVYSFGVMLLEIICCRRHIEENRVEEESEEVDLLLSDWVSSCLVNGKLEILVRHDPEVLSDFKRFERMALVGLWCIHPEPILRPSMKKVTQMLEGALEVGIPPLLYDQMINEKLY